MSARPPSKNVPEGWVEEWPAMKPIYPGRGLDKSWTSQFPLSCRGRHIINAHGHRFRLKGVNWYGASDVLHVVGGLDVQSLEVICETISIIGFTVVRMPWSNEMLRSPVPDGSVNYEMNPRLRGLPAIAILDEVVRCLGQHKVAVILNNHTTYGEFCGPPSGNSLWFDPAGPFSESQWMADWEMMARRYSKCPQVIGFDLRNEIRPRWSLWPAFGKGNTSKTSWAVRDWADAALNMSLRLLEICPDALIVVERIVWPQRGLTDYAACPGKLLPQLQGRLVLGVHSYSWSGPGRFLPDWSVPSFLQCFLGVLRAVGVISVNYGDMSPQALEKQIFLEWGTVLKNDVCPVWVSEFGADLSNPWEMRWLKEFVGVMASLDVDWAYWPLNVGPKPSCRTNEAYGILDPSWKPQTIRDDRLELMQTLGLDSRVRPVSRKTAAMELKRAASNQELRALYGEKDPLGSMRVLSFENVQSAVTRSVTSRKKLVPRPHLFLASSAPDFSALSDINDGEEATSPLRKKSSSDINVRDVESLDNR